MQTKSTIVFLLLILQSSLLAEISVTARFNPPRIAMGDRAQYLIEITETKTDGQPKIEQITSLPITSSGGLNLANGRTSSSQQTRIINGAAEYTVTQSLIIDASPPSVGNFSIPGFAFEYKGQRLNAPSARLQVVERSADAGPTRDELIFLKADLPESLYVGQTTPIELKLYVSDQARLSGLHSFDRSADGFTISELPDNSIDSTELYEGRRYRVRTWPMTITPIQTGKQNVNFQFSLTAQLPNTQSNRDPIGRSPFGRSIFDDFFGRSERLNVYTDAASIDILPLPIDGQPRSFSGAIGTFSIEVGSDDDSTVQGEPIMLSVILNGEGNFERIEGPTFEESPDWRHYDPEKKFEQSDTLGLQGSQRYDYVFIPRRAGKLKLPETVFSYFDPSRREYVELKAPSIDVKVEAAQNTFAPQSSGALPHNAESNVELSRTLTAEEALLTLEYRKTSGRSIGTSILQSPVFLAANGLAAICIAVAAIALGRMKADREDPSYPIRQAAKRELKENRDAYRRALNSNDAGAFYKHILAAIRSAATLKSSTRMHSANGEQIGRLLKPEITASCQALFAEADASRFGGSLENNLKQAHEAAEHILKELEK